MSKKFGYIVDLSGYKFDESTNTTWIMGSPLGKYNHPIYGEIDMTPERCKAYADGVVSKVRGQDLDIDYDHKAKVEHAAGWVQTAEARSDGLWLQVEWTPDALKKLKDKEYRYFSPEFEDEWTHPVTGVKHKDVLFGGGLTNRPYLKGIMPINLSEFTTETKPEGSKELTPEQRTALITKYKLDDNATDEQIIDAAQKAELKDVDPAKEPDPTKTAAQLKEMEESIKQLKEDAKTNSSLAPMIKLMENQAAQLKEFGDKIATQEAALRLTELDGIVKKFDEKAKEKGYAIPKPVLENATKFLNEHSKTRKFNEEFSTLLTDVFESKLVELGERRKNGSRKSNNEDSATKKFMDSANKLVKESDGNMTFADATERVAKDDPELFEDYLEESRGGGDN